MKFLIEVEPENIFERSNLKVTLRNYIKFSLPSKFELKKNSIKEITDENL